MQTWLPHRREEDDELLGFLVPDGELFVPVTIFGYVLGTAVDEHDAVTVLESVGLSYLAERWTLRLETGAAISVQLVEARPDRVVVKNVDFGHDGDYGELFRLDAPVGPDRLRMN